MKTENDRLEGIADGLPNFGFVRLTQIIAPGGPLPISRSTWWEGIRAGRYPRPVELGPRITAWRCDDIRNALATLRDEG